MSKRLVFAIAALAATCAIATPNSSALTPPVQAEHVLAHRQVSSFIKDSEDAPVRSGAFIDGTFLVGVFESVLSKNNVNSIVVMT
jgi:hypothetical protein